MSSRGVVIPDDLWPYLFYWSPARSCLRILTTSKHVYSLISPTDKARSFIRRALLPKPFKSNSGGIQSVFESTFCTSKAIYPTTLMKELIHRGANPRVMNDKALLCACLVNNEPVVRYLLDPRVGADVHTEDVLFEASNRGYDNIVRVLLEFGADVHTRDVFFEASRRGYDNIVRVLLEFGADVHEQNDRALRWASRWGAVGVVRLLLKAGADVHATDDIALLNASAMGHAAIVRILLEGGADVNAGNGAALLDASRYAKDNVVRLLLESGANVGIKRALGEALRYGHEKVIRILYKK